MPDLSLESLIGALDIFVRTYNAYEPPAPHW